MLNRVQRLQVLAVLGADFHNGMRSRGYKLMCRAVRILRKDYGINLIGINGLNFNQKALYMNLAGRYGNKL